MEILCQKSREGIVGRRINGDIGGNGPSGPEDIAWGESRETY